MMPRKASGQGLAKNKRRGFVLWEKAEGSKIGPFKVECWV